MSTAKSPTAFNPSATAPAPRPLDDASATARSFPRAFFWGTALLAIALVPTFFAQVFWARALVTPWYVPIGGSIAALVLSLIAWRHRRWWRVGVALFTVALACFEWFFVVAGTRLPDYQGPIAVGGALPAFHAVLADQPLGDGSASSATAGPAGASSDAGASGTAIDESYFRQGRDTVLVFFQGRWCPFCMTQLTELESHHDEFARAGAEVVVVSIEDPQTAAETQRDFPHLKVVSDAERELADAIEVINRGFSPDGGDSAAPTILLLDGTGTVRWLHRPQRFIARPSSAELLARLAELRG